MLQLLYPALRPLLFRMDPERAHEITLATLRWLHARRMLGLLAPRAPSVPVRVMGINFPNPVGLAAGLDKNGTCIDALGRLGFGFLEVGTVTPRPQPGNPAPRMFRIPEREALINRMGFNNRGVDALVAEVRAADYQGVLGINIGRNKDTRDEDALQDYLDCMRKVYPVASYITVNVSSPNTPGLRDLQARDALKDLAGRLRAEQIGLEGVSGRHVPLVLKIAPDLDEAGVSDVAGIALDTGIGGIIATNTTVSREAVAGLPHAEEGGGLSGAPLRARSTEVVRQLAAELSGRIPVIASGGVMSAEAATEKLAAGASLVQVYTGLVYRGPALVREILDGVLDLPVLAAREKENSPQERAVEVLR